MAASTIPTARIQKTTFCDHYFALDLGAELERLGLRHRLHPLTELLLVVQELGDAGFGYSYRAPEGASNGQTSTQIPQYMQSA
jgi:hypothetical protein